MRNMPIMIPPLCKLLALVVVGYRAAHETLQGGYGLGAALLVGAGALIAIAILFL